MWSFFWDQDEMGSPRLVGGFQTWAVCRVSVVEELCEPSKKRNEWKGIFDSYSFVALLTTACDSSPEYLCAKDNTNLYPPKTKKKNQKPVYEDTPLQAA